MARYRVVSEKGAYMARSSEVVRLELGADAHASRMYGVRAQVCELLVEGTEIEFDGIPGPHLEPLDDAARAAMAAYVKKFPGATLDPTRHLPLGQDPLLQPTFEQAMLRSLERISAESEGQPARPSAADEKLEKLIETVAALAAIVAAQHGAPARAPVMPRKG